MKKPVHYPEPGACHGTRDAPAPSDYDVGCLPPAGLARQDRAAFSHAFDAMPSAIHRLRRHLRPLARAGCVAIGAVYALVGLLALLALFGVRTGAADEDRMVDLVEELPGGLVVIWGIVIGSAGYLVWRALEALTDPYDLGQSWRGVLQRAGIGLSGAGYGLLAYSAARIARTPDAATPGAERQQQMIVAQVLDWPFGAWWVGGAGITLMGIGLLQYALLARRTYATALTLDGRSAAMRRLVHVLACYGYAARGVILGVLGYLLVRAALTLDPGQSGDTDTAFDVIGGGPVGDSAFFVVAVGTVAYGAFMFLCAAYYRFPGKEREATG